MGDGGVAEEGGGKRRESPSILPAVTQENELTILNACLLPPSLRLLRWMNRSLFISLGRSVPKSEEKSLSSGALIPHSRNAYPRLYLPECWGKACRGRFKKSCVRVCALNFPVLLHPNSCINKIVDQRLFLYL